MRTAHPEETMTIRMMASFGKAPIVLMLALLVEVDGGCWWLLVIDVIFGVVMISLAIEICTGQREIGWKECGAVVYYVGNDTSCGRRSKIYLHLDCPKVCDQVSLTAKKPSEWPIIERADMGSCAILAKTIVGRL